MKRKIIHIDEEKCNGCGVCATACHEGAIGMMNGKAKLLRDDYCDGFGDCLPACPTGAISFTEREAAAYDEQAVLKNKKKLAEQAHERHIEGGCPGHRLMQFSRKENEPSAQETAERESSVRAYENAFAAESMAVPDPPSSRKRPLLSRCKTADCRGLHGVCVRKHARKIHERKNHPDRLPETRRYRLRRKTDGHHTKQRREKRDDRTHGSALLRRIASRGGNGIEKQRKIYSVERCRDFLRRQVT